MNVWDFIVLLASAVSIVSIVLTFRARRRFDRAVDLFVESEQRLEETFDQILLDSEGWRLNMERIVRDAREAFQDELMSCALHEHHDPDCEACFVVNEDI